MDIFCQKCQQSVGQVADARIPVGKKASVKCPVCGEKIVLSREVAPPFDPEITILEGGGMVVVQPLDEDSPGFGDGQAATATGDFTIGGVLKEAWQKTSGLKGPVWGAAFMIFLVIIGMTAAGWLLSSLLGGDGDNVALSAALQITLTVALYPLMAGVVMLGVRHSVGLKVNWKMAFGYFSCLLPLVIAALLSSVLTFVGFLLLIVPGIYLSIAYLLIFPLVVDKGMDPWQALEASRKAIHPCWFKVFGLYFVMTLICLLSMIPLGLGMIWTLPMFVMVSAILYRELFGVSEKA